ncbi:uncharacterized protein LOC144987877 isoform X1 [Oryzias latipes]
MLRERRPRMAENRENPSRDLINLRTEHPSAPLVSEGADAYFCSHSTPARQGGDLRQLLGVTATVTEIQSMEQRAGVQDHLDSTLLVDVQAPVFTAMRELFPDPVTAAPTSFPYTDKDPSTYYSECVQKWIDNKGRDPGLSLPETVIFRTAILAGLPQDLQDLLKADPDLLAGDESRFKRHLIHHCRAHLEKKERAEGEVEQLKTQLLRLQLAQARKESTQDKKGVKKEYNMMSLVPPEPAAMMWQAQAFGGRGRRRSGYSGRHGPPRGPPPAAAGDECFICGAPDHWARHCPQRGTQQHHAQTRGRGRPGQHPRPLQAPPPPWQGPQWWQVGLPGF